MCNKSIPKAISVVYLKPATQTAPKCHLYAIRKTKNRRRSDFRYDEPENPRSQRSGWTHRGRQEGATKGRSAGPRQRAAQRRPGQPCPGLAWRSMSRRGSGRRRRWRWRWLGRGGCGRGRPGRRCTAAAPSAAVGRAPAAGSCTWMEQVRPLPARDITLIFITSIIWS